MSSPPTKGLIAFNADGDRVDAARRLLADWLKLVGRRIQGDAAGAIDVAPSSPRLPAIDGTTDTSASAEPHLPAEDAADAPGASDDALPTAVVELGLPPRMSQVLVGLLAGAAEKQIARELALSPHTVHAYVKQIYKRLSVTSRGELLARFVTLNR